MVAQRTNSQVFPALRNSANASVRLLSWVYRFLGCAQVGRVSQLSSLVNSNVPVRQTITTTAMSVRLPAMVTIPHSQPSLIHPTL